MNWESRKLVYHLPKVFLSNKSEQKSEDEYEFWKIDLSDLADWWERFIYTY